MAENENPAGGGLPPKIDLRKSGVLKPKQASSPGEAPTVTPPVPADPSPTDADAVSQAPRLSIPARPLAAGARPVARPKTIGATPISKISPTQPATVEGSTETSATADDGALAAPRTPTAIPRPVAVARPMSIKAKPVGDAPASASQDDPSVRIAAKRETTKIPLDAARPKEAATQKTLKAVKVISRLPVPPAAPAVTAESPSDDAVKQASVAASKRTTSRVSLEAVLGGGEADEAEGGPKTIRLKRPGAAASSKVSPVTTIQKRPGAVTPDDEAVVSEDAGDEATVTQKKTVVVKRSGTARARKKVSVSRAEGGAAASEAGEAPAPMQKKVRSEPGWVFAVYALAATLVTCVLIYVLTAQVVGPNASLTEYSYSKTGPELPWPGKLSGAARPASY